MLTNEDIAVLLKALDAYETQVIMGDVSKALSSSDFLLAKTDDDARQVMEKKLEDARQKSEQTRESIILLKAKLIQMKDRATVEEAKKFLLDGGNS